MGGALGLAVLVAVAVIRTTGLSAGGVPQRVAQTAGYGAALRVGAVLMLAAAVMTALVMQPRVGIQSEPGEGTMA